MLNCSRPLEGFRVEFGVDSIKLISLERIQNFSDCQWTVYSGECSDLMGRAGPLFKQRAGTLSEHSSFEPCKGTGALWVPANFGRNLAKSLGVESGKLIKSLAVQNITVVIFSRLCNLLSL